MKKILHSGQFLDYDGNTIKVTFYKEKHLWVSRTSITTPYTGGEYEVEVWSDAGDAVIYDSAYDWISHPTFIESFTRNGCTVYKYKITVAGRPLMGYTQTGDLNVGVETTTDTTGYEGSLNKTITITRL